MAFGREDRNSGEFGIILANADGSSERVLISAKGASWYTGPASWSPDGKLILCGRGKWKPKIHSELVAVQVADGKEVWQTSLNWSLGGFDPAWLPDGKAILVCARSESATARSQIYLIQYPSGKADRVSIDLDQYFGLNVTADGLTAVVSQSQERSNIWVGAGTDWKQITTGKQEGMFGVEWSSDDHIYIASQRTDATGIWKSALDGSGAEQVVSGESIVHSPSVSPDGRSITYTSLSLGVPSIWRADSDGKNAKVLTADGEDYKPSFTPDGKWIIFMSWRSGPLLLYRVPAMGGELVKITDQTFNSPAISPDGKSIAGFYTDSTDSDLKIGILDIESGKVIKTLPRPAMVETGNVVWTKDGKHLIAVETKSNISNLVSLPIDGGAATQLTQFSSEAIRSFALSPDGKRFVLSRGPANVDLFLMTNFR